MNDGEDGVDESGPCEQAVHQTEDGPQPPAAVVDRGEDRVVDEREALPGDEVQGVADRLRPDAIRRDRRAQQERQVHACQPELAARAQRRREDERPDQSARNGAPDAHRMPACSQATAALTSARWTSPWGRLPRNSPVLGSISSAYRPTSLASSSSSVIVSAASSVRPPRASASTSQNEQHTNDPSLPRRPSSPL